MVYLGGEKWIYPIRALVENFHIISRGLTATQKNKIHLRSLCATVLLAHRSLMIATSIKKILKLTIAQEQTIMN